jgi:hypothetical protein
VLWRGTPQRGSRARPGSFHDIPARSPPDISAIAAGSVCLVAAWRVRRCMTTTPQEPDSDPEIAPSGDPSNDPIETDPEQPPNTEPDEDL